MLDVHSRCMRDTVCVHIADSVKVHAKDAIYTPRWAYYFHINLKNNTSACVSAYLWQTACSCVPVIFSVMCSAGQILTTWCHVYMFSLEVQLRHIVISRRQWNIAISGCAQQIREYPSIRTQESFFSSECYAYFYLSCPHIFCTLTHEYCMCDAGSQLCLHWLLFSGLINVQDGHNSMPRDQSDALQIASIVQPTVQKPNTVHRLSWVTKASCKCLAFLPEKWQN